MSLLSFQEDNDIESSSYEADSGHSEDDLEGKNRKSDDADIWGFMKFL